MKGRDEIQDPILEGRIILMILIIQ